MYSAFSLRSPRAAAASTSATMRGRSTDQIRSCSVASRLYPSGVMYRGRSDIVALPWPVRARLSTATAGPSRRRGVCSALVKITDLLRFARERGEPVFSFEFFPPRTDQGVAALFQAVEALRPLAPAYVCVTYGAGGSTRVRTIELVKRLKHEVELEAMAHITCVGASRDELAAVLDELAEAGIRNVMALRGDPPRGEASFTPHPQGFRYASELVAFIRAEPKRWPFCLGAAAYPEGHLETRDLARDVANLKVKVDAGAAFLATQLFFDNSRYFQFLERARATGIAVPVLPGI